MKRTILTVALLVLVGGRAAASPPTADDLLKSYDATMGPENFDSVSQMVAHRDDGSERAYKMRVLKSGKDKMRVWFQEPAAVKGQEMLRQGENLWVYMPSLKRVRAAGVARIVPGRGLQQRGRAARELPGRLHGHVARHERNP